MAYLGQKNRGRLTRTLSIRPTAHRRGDWRNLFRDRQAFLRALLAVLTIAAIVVAVQAWQKPFPYRLGQHAENGIAARIDFERENPVQTERDRERTAAQRPYLFKHDPAPLRKLPTQLTSELRQLAAAKEPEALSPELRNAFGLAASPGAEALDADTVRQRFQQLQAAATDEERLREIERQFREFLDPLDRTGLLVVPAAGVSFELHPNDTLAIVSENDHRELVMASEVQLAELLRPRGALGEGWEREPVLVPIQPMLERWLTVNAPGTLVYDAAATQAEREQARNGVATVKDTYRQGNLIVPPGQTMDHEHLALLRAEYDAAAAKQGPSAWIIRVATVTLMVLVLAVLNGIFLVRHEPALIGSLSRLSVYLASVVVAIALARLMSSDPWRAEVIPLASTVMILAIAYNQVLAAVTGASMTLVLALSIGADLAHFVILIGSVLTAVIPSSAVSSRSKLIIVGVWAAASYFILTWGMGLLQTQSVATVWFDRTLLLDSLRGAGWCLASGFLVAGSLPFIESAFGVVTNISLLELGDVSHPLLQELVRRAPGTYNHSVTMGSIAETAADAIGANGLLCRIGAYFHDIGKMVKPEYFVENMIVGTESRHHHLAPAISTLIIIGHVKDGVDLAERYGLPQPLIDFIEQHHGTTLVEYFYREAAKQADQNPDHKFDAQESHFRYPGPKPQTKEAGVLMLSDAVESASRTLSEPTPKRIERLVHDLLMKRLLDGQFEESTLTMTELHTVQQSLVKSLIGIYHGRIKYPEQRTA